MSRYEKRYRDKRKCDECKQVKWCLYTPTGPFRGTWRCLACEEKDSDALADIVKAATRRLSK